jgi:O-antigen ligase
VSGAALLAGLALILAATLLPALPERFSNLGSGVLRWKLWESSLHMLADHPILGVGPDQFLNQFQSKYATEEQQAENWTAHPHNIVLDYWLSLGIMGLMVLVWLLWRFFRETIGTIRAATLPRPNDLVVRALALGLAASMVNFLVHGLVDNSYFLMDLAMIFWLSCGLLQLSRVTLGSESQVTSHRSQVEVGGPGR